MTPRPDNMAVLSRRIEKHDSDCSCCGGGCWLWTGGTTSGGYGQVQIDRRTVPVHRLVYELLVGPIPDGLTLDHLCRTRRCVNPAHLEPVTTRENTLRGETVTAANAEKTHCPNGHAYDEVISGGRRSCSICRKQRKRDWARRDYQRRKINA